MTGQLTAIQHQRPASLKAIVVYKGLIVLVLLALSAISGFSWRHYDSLAALAQDALTNGELGLGAWFLKTVLHSQPQGLRVVARITGIYALVMGTATVGLWYGKAWANPLMLVMAALPLPLEVQELLHDLSWQRLGILLLNLAVVGYLLKHQLAEGFASEKHSPS
ncbi:MAG: DUF2127 domain-containing protein [Leptolyngbya sp. LCM1.Bin17]|nr:MAG: DUF2127 domain-containing protein [Leptolyngbya sp. LCM1.Bin17]